MFFVNEILANALGFTNNLGRVGYPKQTVLLGLTEKNVISFVVVVTVVVVVVCVCVCVCVCVRARVLSRVLCACVCVYERAFFFIISYCYFVVFVVTFRFFFASCF